MSESASPLMSLAELERFRSGLKTIEQAFLDWAEITGVEQRFDFEFEGIDEEGVQFGFIEWGYEPRYDGWETHRQTMPLSFLTEPGCREQLLAAETEKRERAAREQKAAAERARQERARRQEERDRAELERLLARYPDAKPAEAGA